MLVLFLVTFVNLLGFGLLTPLLPFYVERVGGGPELITIIIASYSLMQFLIGPTIGRLSDKYGRKPLLSEPGFPCSILWILLASSYHFKKTYFQTPMILVAFFETTPSSQPKASPKSLRLWEIASRAAVICRSFVTPY